jgi:hypothetical protein
MFLVERTRVYILFFVVLIAVLFRDDNWARRVKFVLGLGGLGQFDLLEEIGSG